MLSHIQLDPQSETPLYRQLFDLIRDQIESGTLARGERLPPTRELAVQLGLNRTTVSAAYERLETDRLIQGHVGRGSFVRGPEPRIALAWEQVLAEDEGLRLAGAAPEAAISFATSRPSERLFPLDDFRLTCAEVLASSRAAQILQLGSPAGYAPLREHLAEGARSEGAARAGDDVVVTSGCQQGLDLLQRVLVRPGDTVIVEDPVYPGLRTLFQHSGAHLAGIPVGPSGIDIDALERAMAAHPPRLVVVTPNFQNPTGATMPLDSRLALLRLARQARAVLAENDIYGGLRYAGERVPTIKELDDTGDTVLLRSFSKIAFPGLRVGWVVAPHPLAARLAEAKQWTDLHTDQLSQAILLRFAESGRLAAHHARIVAAGAERLHAVLEACERRLPAGSRFSRPQGGMNLWVRLPEPLDAGELLGRAQREGVSYLPGRFFAVSRHEPGGLRLSFAGLEPAEIRKGVAVLGEVFADEMDRVRRTGRPGPAPAMV
ncbi:MAG: PLP-dependent aminotransferase family protein [Acidobacteria bacterium]|nr:PLP-dependent aminotransferase family protein [Acidobacteriota bacterium]